MQKAELIKRSFDANAVIYQGGVSAEGLRINPLVWEQRLREFQEKLLVVTPLAESFDFTGPGSDFKVTIDTAPTALSSSLVETNTVGVSASATRQVVFTPSEEGTSMQLSYAEAARALFDVEGRFMRKLGYLLAERKDALAWTAISGGATTNLFSNAKTVSSDIATTDTLNLTDITKAVAAIESLYYVADTLIISPKHKQQLMTDSSIIKLMDAAQFGTRAAVANGLVGELYGLRVYMSHAPAVAANRLKAVVLGRTRSGEAAFGYATKRAALIETFRDIEFRQIKVVATEEYQFKVLHADAIATITSYSA